MMARRGVMGLLAGGAAALLGGCGILGSEASYRYRITVEVESPNGIVRGSSVHEETATLTSLRIGDSTGKGAILRGEAVMVELADGPLFVLLVLPHAKGSLAGAVTVALDPAAAGPERDDYFNAVRGLGGWFGSARAELPREDWPLMVRFRDLDDPTSVERVDPANLAAQFGPGVRLKRILLETTSDEVTTGIEKRLAWIDSNPKFSNKFEQYNGWIPENEIGVAEQISPRDFSTEFGK